MGLLDALNSEQGRMALGLLAAAGPSRQPMNVGQRLGGLFEQMDARKAAEQERAQRAQMQQAQMQMMQMQLGEHQAQAAQRAKAEQQAMIDADVLRQSFAPQQGPTPDGSPLMPNRLDPRFMIGRGASLPAVSQAMQLDSMLNPQAKPADFKVVGGSLVRIGGDGQVAEAYRQPDAPEKTPEALRTLEAIYGKGTPAYLKAVQQLGSKMTTHGQGTVVNVGEKAPPGYRWAAGGTGLEPIPGGPADKLPEAQQKQVVGTQNLRSAISEYRDQLKGFGGVSQFSPDSYARMGTKYNNMMLQAKEAYNLGVLNGPDLAILESVVTDPRSLRGVITSKSALDEQARELDRIMSKVSSVSSQVRPRGPGGAVETPMNGAQGGEDPLDPLGMRKGMGR